VRPSVDLLWLLRLTQPQYVEAFRGSAIKRAKAWMLRRNAAVALGNVGTPNVIEAVARAMAHDEHPIVRGHAAWALGRLSVRHRVNDASDMLAAALKEEADAVVRTEIDLALLTALGSGDRPWALHPERRIRSESGGQQSVDRGMASESSRGTQSS
jgi:epoxyqueuosine reductase